MPYLLPWVDGSLHSFRRWLLTVLGKGANNQGKTAETPNCQKEHKQAFISPQSCWIWQGWIEWTNQGFYSWFPSGFPVMSLEELMQGHGSSEFWHTNCSAWLLNCSYFQLDQKPTQIYTKRHRTEYSGDYKELSSHHASLMAPLLLKLFFNILKGWFYEKDFIAEE